MLLHSYKEKAQEASSAFRDQPMPPLQTAIFWLEYVIRHRGAPHMRSAAVDLDLLKYHNFDVLFLILVSALVITYVSYLFFSWTFRKSRNHPETMISVKKKN